MKSLLFSLISLIVFLVLLYGIPFIGFSILNIFSKELIIFVCIWSLVINIYFFNVNKDRKKDILYLRSILKEEHIQIPLTKNHIHEIAQKWARCIREGNSAKIDNAGKEYKIYADIRDRLEKIMYQ